mmetsp:Transcript_14546/g.41664  ORF Transcript_14546/g.41664 Transcript_14546/m.41664 type:complete len:216 (+) Transcript_14546:544-1191(+)
MVADGAPGSDRRQGLEGRGLHRALPVLLRSERRAALDEVPVAQGHEVRDEAHRPELPDGDAPVDCGAVQPAYGVSGPGALPWRHGHGADRHGRGALQRHERQGLQEHIPPPGPVRLDHPGAVGGGPPEDKETKVVLQPLVLALQRRDLPSDSFVLAVPLLHLVLLETVQDADGGLPSRRAVPNPFSEVGLRHQRVREAVQGHRHRRGQHHLQAHA